MVNETKLGTLEFCGTVNFAGGTWAGVELDEAEGKNDGTVNGITYFNCEPGFGVLVPTNKIEKVKGYCKLTLIQEDTSYSVHFLQ